MAPTVKNMTEGKPLPLIINFALPLMLGNIFQQLYTVVDTMVVGKALGVDALAALGATDWMYWLVVGLIAGVTQGFAIPMAREFGARRYDSLRQVVGGSVVMSAICTVIFFSGAYAATRPVLELLRTPEEIIGSSLLYVRTLLCGMPVVMAYNLLSCVLRALGDGKTPLNAMIAAALANIAMDLLFVLVFDWGILGAAVATLIAQVVADVFCLAKLWKLDFMRLKKEDFRLSGSMALQLVGMGMPLAFQNAIIAVGGMIIQTVVNGFGVTFIAGFTATNKLYGVLEMAASSYGYAMTTYAGQNLGAGKPGRIRQGMRCAIVVAMVTSLIIGGAMILFGRGIVGLFISGTPEEITQATGVAYRYLTIMSLCLPVLYILHVARSAVQGMGDTVLPMVSGIAEFVMRTGGVLFLPAVLGDTGIFVAEVLAWAGADLILVPSYYITIRRVTKKLEGSYDSQ